LIVPQSRHARLFRTLLWKRLNDEGYIACIRLPLVMKQLDWDGQNNLRTIYRPADSLRLRLTWKTSETVTTFSQMINSRKAKLRRTSSINLLHDTLGRHGGSIGGESEERVICNKGLNWIFWKILDGSLGKAFFAGENARIF
jgi:hypothetical protein